MVKATIKRKDGTSIVIEGSEDEVNRVISLVDGGRPARALKPKENKDAIIGKMSIGDMILELKDEKFFDKPRSLVEIKNALSEKGGIYAITTLSAPVIRLVRKRNLGRVRQNKKWMYVKR